MNDRWDFGGGSNKKMDKTIGTALLNKLADTSIVRHMKIKGDYNPYDPDWMVYGEELRMRRMSKEIWSKQRAKLWLDQSGLCALCGTPIDTHDDCHDHHIVYRQYGGSDELSNRVLLHRVCHVRAHALGLEVTKPVPAQGL